LQQRVDADGPRAATLLCMLLAPGARQLVLVFIAVALCACGGANETGSLPSSSTPVSSLPPDASTYYPDSTWRTATPEQVGVPSDVLARVGQRIASRTWRGLDSFIVVRRGYLVHETYYGTSSRDDVHTMQSVSKSITSVVTGIASDAGSLNIEAPMLSLLPQYADASPDPRLAQVALRHLLEMRSGINFYEYPYPGSPLETLNTSRGSWVRIALEQPFNAEPGALWQYNSGGVIVVGAAVASATTTPFYAYARERLFTPLGISGQYWILSGYDDTVHTGGGLYLRAIDLARVGYLVLKQGQWSGRQIVSRDWLTRSTAPVTFRTSQFGGVPVDYGLLWWMAAIDSARSTADVSNRIIIASGNMNQFLFVVPSLDLVVVNTGATNDSFGVTVDFVVRELIPTIRG
jgi:CubicO group peptidase (beta-lactamase class C family)